MLAGAEAGQVGVVVELHELGTPPHQHRVARVQHGGDEGAEAQGPVFDGADRGGSPVGGSDHCAAFATTTQKREIARVHEFVDA